MKKITLKDRIKELRQRIERLKPIKLVETVLLEKLF